VCAFVNPNAHLAENNSISAKMHAPMRLFFTANGPPGGDGRFFFPGGAPGFGMVLCGFLLPGFWGFSNHNLYFSAG
jgi:hypothetical protein